MQFFHDTAACIVETLLYKRSRKASSNKVLNFRASIFCVECCVCFCTVLQQLNIALEIIVFRNYYDQRHRITAESEE